MKYEDGESDSMVDDQRSSLYEAGMPLSSMKEQTGGETKGVLAAKEVPVTFDYDKTELDNPGNFCWDDEMFDVEELLGVLDSTPLDAPASAQGSGSVLLQQEQHAYNNHQNSNIPHEVPSAPCEDDFFSDLPYQLQNADAKKLEQSVQTDHQALIADDYDSEFLRPGRQENFNFSLDDLDLLDS